MNKINFLIALTLSAIFLLSCSSDDDNSGPSDSYYRIKSKKYYFSDLAFDELTHTYDRDGKIIKIETRNNKGSVIFIEKFYYDKQNLIKIERGTADGIFAEQRFFYTNNKLSADEYWMKDSITGLKKTSSNTFEYENDILKKVASNFNTGGASFYSIYTYEGNNIKTIKAYDMGTNELLEEDLFKYDNQTNPYYKFSLQYAGHPICSSVNNVTYSKITSYKHIPSNPELTFEYTYNTDGYPSEKYIVGQNGKRYLDESFTYGVFY